MATYIITGKMGTGKTKSAVRIIQVALAKGLRVATNLDLNTDKLNNMNCRGTPIRIPDKPNVLDLESIGCGNESYDEERNGVIVLDELASWLNSRTFNDKSRQPVLDWLIHSRKKGWHVYFICQNLAQIDKQVREALVEFTVRCSRMDKVKIPFFGWILNTFKEGSGYLPRMHVASVRMGTGLDGMVADRWYYRGDDLHVAYDTRQIFSDKYEHGPHSLLSAWHIKGRHPQPAKPKGIFAILSSGVRYLVNPEPRKRIARPLNPAWNAITDKDARWSIARNLVLTQSDGNRVGGVRSASPALGPLLPHEIPF